MSALPSLGHVHPCLAVAEVLRQRGHEVRMATAPGLAGHVRAAGFTQCNFGFDVPRPGDQLTPRLAERLYRWLVGSFGFWVEDLQEQAQAWSPDVLLHDWSQPAGAAVGAKLGIPSAVLGNAVRPPLPQATQSRCWLGVDLDALGGPRVAFGDLLLNLYPPSFAVPGDERLPHEHYLRPPGYDGGAGRQPPAWLDELDAPLVYLTMGTYYARLPGVMESLVAGAAGVAAQVVVTVGHGRDPAEFEPLPPNVRVVQYVPQTQLIPRCAAVICQGSLNALTAALSHGVPVGSLPVTWGDPLGVNGAERCAELGAGLVLPVGGGGQDAPFDDLRPERIRGMIETLLEQPSYRQAAQRIQAEMHSLPGIADSVPLIEALAG